METLEIVKEKKPVSKTRNISGSLAVMEALVAETGADELMIVSDVYDHSARLRSFELIAGAAS